MTTTLYLQLEAYPVPNGTQQPTLNAYIWDATDFLNPPVGRTSPPGGLSGALQSTSGGACSFTGLDNTHTYYILVFNPQGYQHWFRSQFIGNSSDNPLVCSVPYIEGTSNPLALVTGPLVQFVSDD